MNHRTSHANHSTSDAKGNRHWNRLASQARHESGAPKETFVSRNVVSAMNPSPIVKGSVNDIVISLHKWFGLVLPRALIETRRTSSVQTSPPARQSKYASGLRLRFSQENLNTSYPRRQPCQSGVPASRLRGSYESVMAGKLQHC
jgi:hypothetical protein